MKKVTFSCLTLATLLQLIPSNGNAANIQVNKKKTNRTEMKQDTIPANSTKKESEETDSINAQIELAREIGENQGYQTYLINIKQIEANRDIGLEQAKALSNADLKIIANEGSVGEGINRLSDVLSSKGGTSLAAMLEGLAQSETGEQLLKKFLSPKDK